MDTVQIIQDLHDSEINGGVSWFYDGVWVAALGDQMNGFIAKKDHPSFATAVTWLREEAIRRFPDSVFAHKYRQ